ncbi:MAG: transglutaminase-like domain-containing protein [Kangiellaceae bacterium]
MRLLLVIVGLCFVWKSQAQSVPSMAKIDVQLAINQSLPLAERISFEILSSNSKKLKNQLERWDNITAVTLKDGWLRVGWTEQPRFNGTVGPEHTRNSFVIDFEEASTLEFTQGFKKQKGNVFTPKELAGYTNVYIENPTYIHGFDIASVAARKRSGDCTEYAVLTVALARSLQLASRVIVGTVIVEGEASVDAFGHAWTEVWHNGRWQIIDAAMVDSIAKRLFYFPASEIDNEGPGYRMSLFNAVSLMPERIRNLKSE